MMRMISLAIVSFAALIVAVPGRASELDNYTYMHCAALGALLPNVTAMDRQMTKKVFEPMEKQAADNGVSVEFFFLNPACEPSYLGDTLMPYMHKAAENSTERRVFVEKIRLYFLEQRKQPNQWRTIVNARNTRGMTALDYIEYIITQKRLIPEEAAGTSAFIDFLCTNGGSYAVFPKHCPKAAEDTVDGIRARLISASSARDRSALGLIKSQPDARKPEDR